MGRGLEEGTSSRGDGRERGTDRLQKLNVLAACRCEEKGESLGRAPGPSRARLARRGARARPSRAKLRSRAARGASYADKKTRTNKESAGGTGGWV